MFCSRASAAPSLAVLYVLAAEDKFSAGASHSFLVFGLTCRERFDSSVPSRRLESDDAGLEVETLLGESHLCPVLAGPPALHV